MSTKSKDISKDVLAAFYSALGGGTGLMYLRKDTITLSGTSGTATVVCNGVSKTATFRTSLTVTASDFVTAFAADYLVSGVVLTSALGVLSFTQVTPGSLFTGSTSITNLTGTLAGAVANANTIYPVYITVPKDAPEIYIRLGEVIDSEDGTKDTFIYNGSVPVIVCDDSQTNQTERNLAQKINNVIRGLLKPTRQSVPAGFIALNHGTRNEYTEQSEMGNPLVRIADVYEFIID